MSTNNWVDDRLATLGGEWRPNLTRARERFEERRATRGGRISTWTWSASAGVLTVSALLAFPGPRAIAQRLWESRILGRVEVARVDLDALPIRWSLTGGYSDNVLNAAEAERKAGFPPRFPPPGIVAGSATLSVIEPMAAQVVINTNELRDALRHAGAGELTVPKEWEGPSFGFQIGPVVEADYGEVIVRQCRPVVLITPPGFSIAQFAEAAFRIGGLGPEEARTLAAKFQANPSWLIGIRRNTAESVQEVLLQSGPGILMESPGRVSIIWSAPDRVYEVNGNISPELAKTVANSIR